MSEQVNATPAAEEKARELGMAVEAIEGTGKDGQVTVEDVKKVAAQGSAIAETPAEETVGVVPNPLLGPTEGVFVEEVLYPTGPFTRDRPAPELARSEFERMQREHRFGQTEDDPEGHPLLVEEE